ncbi:MAG: hypothetical protein J6J17_02770 [Bacilli bacterium]|nr:hypothetical protein [Bacilli bacterium]
MEIKELKSIIKNPDYPKKNFLSPLTIFNGDSFRISSIMYNQDIYLNSLSSIYELYRKIEEYELSSEIFKQPFYLIVSLEDFNDNTVDILNGLDENIVVQIETIASIGDKEKEFFSKITKKNIYFYCQSWINQDSMKFILSKFKSDPESSPVLVIDRIDSETVDLLNECLLKYPEIRCRIEIKDLSSIRNLNTILHFIPEYEILIFLDDNLFNDKNPNNIRNFILQQDFSIDLNIPEGKKIKIDYNGLEYKSLEDVFNLERYLEIVKSHIPSNASELDIVSYVSLFEANYFTYDYEKYERIKKFEKNEMDSDKTNLINLTEFITSRKGVCIDYAEFTKYLLISLNVDCEVLETDSEFYYDYSTDEGHAFNLIRIGGKEYFLDNTWLAETLQSGQINFLAESPYFLASNEDFHHEDYKTVLDRYHCETMDRNEVAQSTNRVLNWNKNYIIHPQALKDLFRKHIMEKKITIESQIENAIPGRRC